MGCNLELWPGHTLFLLCCLSAFDHCNRKWNYDTGTKRYSSVDKALHMGAQGPGSYPHSHKKAQCGGLSVGTESGGSQGLADYLKLWAGSSCGEGPCQTKYKLISWMESGRHHLTLTPGFANMHGAHEHTHKTRTKCSHDLAMPILGT